MSMTLEQFLNHLSATDRTWTIVHGRLRMPAPQANPADRTCARFAWHCPITAVAASMGTNPDDRGAAEAAALARTLELPKMLTNDIILATDTRGDAHDLRQLLLTACDLTDEHP